MQADRYVGRQTGSLSIILYGPNETTGWASKRHATDTDTGLFSFLVLEYLIY